MASFRQSSSRDPYRAAWSTTIRSLSALHCRSHQQIPLCRKCQRHCIRSSARYMVSVRWCRSLTMIDESRFHREEPMAAAKSPMQRAPRRHLPPAWKRRANDAYVTCPGIPVAKRRVHLGHLDVAWYRSAFLGGSGQRYTWLSRHLPTRRFTPRDTTPSHNVWASRSAVHAPSVSAAPVKPASPHGT